MNGNRWARLDPKIVFFACDAFLKGKTPQWIANEIRTRFGEPMHRTQVYRVIAEARNRNFFHLTPPRDQALSDAMMWRFVRSRVPPRNDKTINVVSMGFEVTLDHVAIAAAETAAIVIKDTHARNPNEPVHVGFGAGQTTMLVARYLAERLRGEELPPSVVLHACSSGFNVEEPATAPVAFFNFFHGIPGVTYTGLFAPAYVNAEDWTQTKKQVGVRESFAVKDKLQVVITSLASREDEHGELNRFMRVNAGRGEQTRRLLDGKEGRVGDVMYCPFSSRGPITRRSGIRAVTLFELDQLVEFAATPGKAVILVAGPCGDAKCRRPRDDALLPLLTEPSLDVWSHLVLDDVTAARCLNARQPSTDGGAS